jgi:peptidoglycan/LPS O-acetylase OafA/YrhL
MESGRIDQKALVVVPQARASSFNPSVNGLRGLCVAFVFLFHVAKSGLPPMPAQDAIWKWDIVYLADSASYFVEVFFMISGYVIVMSLRRHATMRGFLFDRFVRIFPLWIPVLLSICVLGPLLGWRALQHLDPLGWLRVLLANLVLLPPLVPDVQAAHPASWSLSYEWLFYLIAAFSVALARASRVPRSVWIPVSVLAVLLGVSSFPRAIFFLSGVAVALFGASPPGARRMPWLAPLALLLFLLLWRSTDVDEAGADGVNLWELLSGGDGPAMLGAFIAATYFFACVAMPESTSLALLRTRALQRLGTISYSFYLCHPLVMFAVKRVVKATMARAEGSWAATLVFALVSAVLSLALAWLCWRWLEKGLGQWLHARKRELDVTRLRAVRAR